MNAKNIDDYTQSLLDRVVAMSKEIDNLHSAYAIVNSRLNKLTSLTAENAKELIEAAAKVEDFARLAVETTKLTEESAKLTNNETLIKAASESSAAAQNVLQLTIDLRINKAQKLKDIQI